MAYYDDYERVEKEFVKDVLRDEDAQVSEEFYGDEYVKIVHDFVVNYVNMPLQKNNTETISQAMTALRNLPFEQSSLRIAFFNNSSQKIADDEIRKKFLTELFLYQFRGLDAKKDLKIFLSILNQDETKEIAALANRYNHYPFIMRFILSVLDAIEPTLEKTTKMENPSPEDTCYDFDDIVYWEDLEDGGIGPDQDDSYEYFADHDYNLFEKDYIEQDKNKTLANICNRDGLCNCLKFYVEQLNNEQAEAIPIHLKKTFLNRFQDHLLEAKILLQYLEEQEYLTSAYSDSHRTPPNFES